MFELIFFTTNSTKLAHARYAAENSSCNIIGFREKTFHASYNEPRILQRNELLHKSYISACKQATSAGINTDRKFFFLEDTSVKISALSSENNEVPGVDVKYWMREMTLTKLQQLIEENGKNESVIVRSDIILHIPSRYAHYFGTSKSFLHFTCSQAGTITKSEQPIKKNLLYPWLDDKTFNKWFIPNGEKLPISLLPIEVANKYDFRLKNFNKMFKHLVEKKILLPQQRQLPLTFKKKKLLIACGFTCAGKTTISQHLSKEHNYLHIEASDFMYLAYYLRNGYKDNSRIADFAELALKEKPEIAAEQILHLLEQFSHFDVIISGFRSNTEIEWLTEQTSYRYEIISTFISADKALRHQRCNSRKREGNTVSTENFTLMNRQQENMGLGELERCKALRHIQNESSLQDFYRSFIDLTIHNTTPQPIHFSPERCANTTNPLNPEKSILIALLSVWSEQEDRPYFTTTEISKITNKLFPKLVPKHKDNISRYFNQNYYPYYEISYSSESNKARYRLSNTGCSIALIHYRELKEKNQC